MANRLYYILNGLIDDSPNENKPCDREVYLILSSTISKASTRTILGIGRQTSLKKVANNFRGLYELLWLGWLYFGHLGLV